MLHLVGGAVGVNLVTIDVVVSLPRNVWVNCYLPTNVSELQILEGVTGSTFVLGGHWNQLFLGLSTQGVTETYDNSTHNMWQVPFSVNSHLFLQKNVRRFKRTL